jgi:hypothetical protein
MADPVNNPKHYNTGKIEDSFTKLTMGQGTIYPENATCVACKRVHEEKSK